MTLEVLFAQQGQAETFLRMVLLGAAFALALTLGGAWRHRHGLSDAADVLCALMLTLAALLVLIHSGEGLRLYALLGCCSAQCCGKRASGVFSAGLENG